MKKILLTIYVLTSALLLTFSQSVIDVTAVKKNGTVISPTAYRLNPTSIVYLYKEGSRTNVYYNDPSTISGITYLVNENMDSLINRSNRFIPSLVKVSYCFPTTASSKTVTYGISIRSIIQIFPGTTSGVPGAKTQVLLETLTERTQIIPVFETAAQLKARIDSLFNTSPGAGTQSLSTEVDDDSIRVSISGTGGNTINLGRIPIDTLNFGKNAGGDSSVVTYKRGDTWYRFAAEDLLGAGDSMYVYRTYTDLYNEWLAEGLVPGRNYQITDHRQIYDQSVSDVTKTAAIEELVLTATSTSTFDPRVRSIDFPEDIIHYDISANTTHVNAAAARGKIFYREDRKGNKARFDFLHILMYRASDLSEGLAFDTAQTTATDLCMPSEWFVGAAAFEFPSFRFLDIALLNSNNLIALSFFEGAAEQLTGNKFFNTVFEGDITQCSNNYLDGCTFGGLVAQMTNIDATNCTIAGQSNYCTTGTWSETDFGENVNKSIGTNYSASTIGGRIDRVFNCAVLTCNLGGRFYWSNEVIIANSDVDGDITGLNHIVWDNTDANCKVTNVSGISHNGTICGFQNCTITGDVAASQFGRNLKVETMVIGKTIDETTYPELFADYPKRLFKGSDGVYYYEYWNGSTTVTNDIP